MTISLEGPRRAKGHTTANGEAKVGIREPAGTGRGMLGVTLEDNTAALVDGAGMERQDGDTLTTTKVINVTGMITGHGVITVMNGRTGTTLGVGRSSIRTVVRDCMRDTRTGAGVEVNQIRGMIMVGVQRKAGGESKT